MENQGEAFSGGVMKGVEKANIFLAFLSGIPFLGQFTAPAIGLLGTLGTIAGGINGVLASRRIRRESARALAAETGLKTVVTAVDNVSGVGKMITSEARKDGTGGVIKAAYDGNLVT